jgi:hypothetical protein
LYPSEGIDQEFRRKPQLISTLSNMLEFPREQVDRNKFEYITKNCNKELNPHLIRWLEFRETLFTIRNFDVMNFAKSFNNITVDENTCRQTRNRYIDTYKNVCIGTIDRLKYILTIIENREIYNWITKEVFIALYVTNAVNLKTREGVLEVLFVKMVELKNKEIKFKGNWKSPRIGEYYEPVVQEMMNRNADKGVRNWIQKQVDD